MKELKSKVPGLDAGTIWIPIQDPSTIPLHQHMAIRIMNPNVILGEDEKYQYPLEDIRVGYWTGSQWLLLGPYPMYDLSRVSNKEQINPDCKVTHYSILSKESLDAYDKRFEPKYNYGCLEIRVSKDYHQDLYMALLCAAGVIYETFQPLKPGSEEEKYYNLLRDLNLAMDDPTSLVEEHP